MSALFLEALKTLAPEPPLPTAEWIEKNLRLPAECCDNPGDFEFYYVPHMYGICAAFDDDEVTDVYCQKAAQIAWTTILIGYIMRRIDQMPSVIIGLFSAADEGKNFSQEKLRHYVESCDALNKKMDVSTTRRTGNSLMHREFPGGYLKLVGSQSVRSVKSTSAPFVFVEEPDDASENVQGQGDSVTLLWERTKGFRRKKRVLGGTPSIKNFSRVEERMKLSDQCVLPVTCHGCGDTHVLSFENVTWLQADEGSEAHQIFGMELPESAAYSCPHCGEIWSDSRRQSNIRNTVEAAMAAGDKFCGWVPTRETNGKIKGFSNLSELYSCIPGSSLAQLVEKHLVAEYYAARGDETKKIAFVNNQLGMPYEYQDGRPDSDYFREIAAEDPDSQHNEFFCPRDGLLVTIGIDVQHDRVAAISPQ